MNSTRWTRLDSEVELHTARYGFLGGVSRSLILALSENSFLVYSPGTDLLESAADILPQDAEVILLAPSAGHTLGLAHWRAHFSGSVVVAANAAKARLLRVTSLTGVNDLSVLESRLPSHVSVHVPPTCKLGEVWLSVESDETVYWVMCDAFMNLASLSDSILIRTLQKLYGLRLGLEVGRMFRFSVKKNPLSWRNL